MFTLFVFHDCGLSYQKEMEAESIEDLKSKMDKCDEEWLRWYLEKDGKMFTDEICLIHKRIYEPKKE